MESNVAHIENPPANPMDLFKEFILKEPNNFITMNLATINRKYGVLNRTVVYRGLFSETGLQENVIFVTEKNSQKYKDIQENPNIALTFYSSPREVRFNGIAKELPADEISKLWQEEPVFARIRSSISECGKPVEWQTLKDDHDKLLKAYENKESTLNQTDSFTAFQIQPIMICFYETAVNQIADRIVYRRNQTDDKTWTFEHVYS